MTPIFSAPATPAKTTRYLIATIIVLVCLVCVQTYRLSKTNQSTDAKWAVALVVEMQKMGVDACNLAASSGPTVQYTSLRSTFPCDALAAAEPKAVLERIMKEGK